MPSMPYPRPTPNVMYGLTHTTEGQPIIRIPKTTKVGIGMPKGRAIMAWIEHKDGQEVWRGSIGYKSKDTTVDAFTFAGRAECEAWYHAKKKSAPNCNFPRKIGWFAFFRDGEDGYEIDFDATEKHGALPMRIPILLLDNEPLFAQYQMWSTTECICKGDGKIGERILSWAKTDPDKALAAEAKAAGARYFPILDGCYSTGCQYADPDRKDACKPHAELRFQLVNNIHLGSTAFYSTTGVRSVQQLFSGLKEFGVYTGGRFRGITLTMCLKSYRTNHNGVAATQWGVFLDIPLATMAAIQDSLVDATRVIDRWRNTPEVEMPRMLEAGEDLPLDEEDRLGAIGMSESDRAEAMDREFSSPDSGSAAAATKATTSALADKIAAAKKAGQTTLSLPSRDDRVKEPEPEPTDRATRNPEGAATPAAQAVPDVPPELQAIRSKQAEEVKTAKPKGDIF